MTTPIFQLGDEYVTRVAALDPMWASFRGVSGRHCGGTDFGPGLATFADEMRAATASP